MKTKISAYQLFSNIILFEYGTASLFYLVPKTKQDAWIAMLIYIIPAIILQLIYTTLWNKYPNDNIITFMPKIFGKFIGYILSVIYIAYFTYIASRVVRDLSELTQVSIMPKMPLLIISLMFVILNIYSTFTGLENISRFSQIFLPFSVIFIIMSWLFISTTPGALKLNNLKPMFEKGIIFVVKEGWPLITFPFGESILFTMLYSSVVETTKVRKTVIFATITIGIILALNNLLFISVLGVDFASTSLFPLLQTLRIMKIGETFDRLDIFVILVLIIGGFFKVSLFMYGAMQGAAQLTNLKDTKYLAVPFGIITLITSQLIAKNYPQHIKIGLDFTVKYIHMPLIIIVPLMALLIYYIKAFFKKNMERSEQKKE